jgi:hypothetical protein
MIGHYLSRNAIGLYSLRENADRVLRCGVVEYATSGDEPGCVILEEDDLLILFFEPVCMPEAVTESTFIPYVRASSLFVWFVFCQSFLFEDPMDPVMTDVNALFREDLFQSDRSQGMAAVYLKNDLFFFKGNR